VYISVRDRPARDGDGRSARQRVAGTVVLLGIVSLLTDISSESVNAILPIYITSVLGMSALSYGFVDGIYQGVSALVRIAGGWWADRSDRPKPVAVLGYGLSMLSRIALLPAHGLASITSVITVDRLGKGLRTAPRDALISSASAPESLGRAFGTHRAMDTFGALVGPLMAFWILILLPANYHAIFVTSFGFAVLGVAVLLLFVPDLRPRRSLAPAESAVTTSLANTVDTSVVESSPSRPTLRLLLDPKLGRLCMAAGILGLVTIGDGFLYLQLSERDSLATKFFPLLYVGTNFAYLALAIPLGHLSDKIGRKRVFLGGNVALLAAYGAAGGPIDGAAMTVVCLLLLGTYYAATDGVLAAIAGQSVPLEVRASGIATAQTVVALARFGSSLCFGLLWTTLGRTEALTITSVAFVVVFPVSFWLLRSASAAQPASITSDKEESGR